MLQHRVHPSSKYKKFSIAGKVFLLGEYAVLVGLPALVSTVPDRFKLTVLVNSPKGTTHIHPQSPVSKLKIWAKKMNLGDLPFQFEDPFHGEGGFGASTAQFAMAYLAHSLNAGEDHVSWNQAWNLYRELSCDEPLLPSGADLVAQWQGGVSFFDPSERHYKNFGSEFDWSSLLVFSTTSQAGRKVPTHEHLKILSDQGFLDNSGETFSMLKQSLLTGMSAIRSHDLRGFGEVMDQYADILSQFGLEVKATSEDRQALRKLPDVLGVKGAGALQSDAILVLMKPNSPHRNQLIETAKSRRLVLVSDGLVNQVGIQCHNS